MLIAITIRVLVLGFGFALSVFLANLFLRKGTDRPAAALLMAVGTWQLATAATVFYLAAAGTASGAMLSVLRQAGYVSAALIPAVLLHVSAQWSRTRFSGLLWIYLSVPLSWWCLNADRERYFGAWVMVVLTVSAVLCSRATKTAKAPVQGFLRVFAGTLVAIAVAVCLLDSSSAVFAVITLAPQVALTSSIYRYDLFGLLIPPRILFALKIGLIFAVYLAVVKALAGFVQEAFDAMGALVELALVLAAAMIWLPLYNWMNAYLSRRSTVYTAFSKRLIEDAARILDLRERVRFLAEEVGRTFGLSRVLLLTSGEPKLIGAYSPASERMDCHPSSQDRLLELARLSNTEIVSTGRTGDSEIRTLLEAAGFTYLFGLWYEGRLNGILLADTAPRVFLDENEAILVGLSAEISHCLETGRLIEEKINLERKLAHQGYLATLGRAAAVIAHEVRNPLSSIKTLTQVIREDADVERRYAQDLKFILAEVDRLNRTVQELLTFSRPALEAGNDVAVSELLQTTAGVLAREYADSQIHIEQHVDPELFLHRASGEAVEQIALNLALNAIQVSHSGSTVTLEAHRSGDDSIAITVQDEGPGISPEVRAHMFEPFFTTRRKGTGLGLAIVRKHVDEMRGSIDVESPACDNHGAKVTVTLPCA